MTELTWLAKERGISTYLSRAKVVEILNDANPRVDHGALDGKTLAKAKERFRIGRHKNKRHLIRALEKEAGAALAEALVK